MTHFITQSGRGPPDRVGRPHPVVRAVAADEAPVASAVQRARARRLGAVGNGRGGGGGLAVPGGQFN